MQGSLIAQRMFDFSFCGYGVTAFCTYIINDFDFNCLHTENHADYTTHLRRIVLHKCAEYK